MNSMVRNKFKTAPILKQQLIPNPKQKLYQSKLIKLKLSNKKKNSNPQQDNFIQERKIVQVAGNKGGYNIEHQQSRYYWALIVKILIVVRIGIVIQLMEILGGWNKEDGLFQEDQQLCQSRRMALSLYRALVSCQQQQEPQPYNQTMNSTAISQQNYSTPQKEQQPTKTNEIISSNTSKINFTNKMVDDSLHIMIRQSLLAFQRALINQFQRQERYVMLLQGKITKMEASLKQRKLQLMKSKDRAKIDRFGQINYVRELQVGISKLQRRQQDLKQQIRAKQALIFYQEQKIKQLEGVVYAKEKQIQQNQAEISQLNKNLIIMKEYQGNLRPYQTVPNQSAYSQPNEQTAENYAGDDSNPNERQYPKEEHSLLEGIQQEGKECGIMPVTYNTIAKRAARCTNDDPSAKDEPSELATDKSAVNNLTTQKLTNRKIQLQNISCQNQTTQKKRHSSAVSYVPSSPGHNMPVSTVHRYHSARTIQTPYYKDIVVLEQEEPSLLSSRSSKREEVEPFSERFPRRNLDFESHENKFLSSLEYSCLQQSHVQHFDLPESSFHPSTPLDPSPLYQSLIDNQLSSYLPLSSEEQYLLTEIQQLRRRITGKEIQSQTLEQTLPQAKLIKHQTQLQPNPSQQISLLSKKLSSTTLECQQLRQQCWRSNQKENELIRLLTKVKNQLSEIKTRTQQLLPCQLCAYLLQQSH